MPIPNQLPGLKVATILLAAYFVIWIPLEGNLGQAVLMGVWVALVTAGYLGQRWLGGRVLGWGWWVVVAAGLGLFVGLGGGVLTLAAMVVKTGLHAHGPEFSRAEINWVIEQLPLWGAAGFLAGLGIGLITAKK